MKTKEKNNNNFKETNKMSVYESYKDYMNNRKTNEIKKESDNQDEIEKLDTLSNKHFIEHENINNQNDKIKEIEIKENKENKENKEKLNQSIINGHSFSLVDDVNTTFIEKILSSNVEWRNTDDVVKVSIKSLYELIKFQNIAIKELEKQIMSKASKSELNQGLSVKASLAQVTKGFNEIQNSLENKASIDELKLEMIDKVNINEYKKEVKLINTNLNNNSKQLEKNSEVLNELKNKVVKFEGNLSEKVSLLNNEEKNILNKTNDAIELINVELNNKADISLINKTLNQKVNKEVFEKEIRELKEIKNYNKEDNNLNTKQVEEMIYNISNKVFQEIINNEENNDKFKDKEILDVSNKKSTIKKTILDHSINKLNEVNEESMKDNNNSNLNINDKKVSKCTLKKKDEVQTDIILDNDQKILKIEENVINIYDILNNEFDKLRKDLNFIYQESNDTKKLTYSLKSGMLELESEIDLMKSNNKILEVYRDKISNLEDNCKGFNDYIYDISVSEKKLLYDMNEIKSTINNIEQFRNEQRKVNLETDENYKNYNEKVDERITTLEKHNHNFKNNELLIHEELKNIEKIVNSLSKLKVERVEFDEFVNHHFLNLKNEMVKTSNIDKIYKNIMIDIDKRLVEIKMEINDKLSHLEESVFHISKSTEEIPRDVDELNKRYSNLRDCFNEVKVRSEEMDYSLNYVNNSLKKKDEIINTLTNEIENMTITFDKNSKSLKDNILDEINGSLYNELALITSKFQDLNIILSNKSDIEDVNKALTSIHEELDTKVQTDDINYKLEKLTINSECLLNENCLIKLIWNNKSLKQGFLIPWESQKVNTFPNNFLINKDRQTILINTAGLYEVFVCFFYKDKKPSFQILVNNEPLLNSGTFEEFNLFNKNKYDLEVHSKNVKVNEFIMMRENSSLSVSISGESEYGVLIIKKLT